MKPHSKSNLKLFFSLLAVVLGFGSQWNCTIQIGEQRPTPPGTDTPPASGSGCVNQMPTYTLGEPPNKDEYTIIAKEFKLSKTTKPEQEARLWAEAQAVSAQLRARRVHNSIWKQPDGSAIVVSVGRYFTEKQANDKLGAILARGFDEAYVGKPIYPKKETGGGGGGTVAVDWAGIVAMLVIVVLVILGVSSQTKK